MDVQMRLPSTLQRLTELAIRLKHRTRIRTRVIGAYRQFWPWLDNSLYGLRKTGYGKDTLKNLYIDLRYGGSCAGTLEPANHAEFGANIIQSSDYTQLEMIFDRNRIEIRPSDVLVDVGCGKGRVFNFWLERGYRNRMVGLELNEDVAAAARQRLRRFPNVTILAGDAIANIPEDGTFFYVYNPFAEPIVRRFAEKLHAALVRKPEVRILYNNCRHIDVFQADPRWHIEFIDVGWRRVRAAMITFRDITAGAASTSAGTPS